MPNDDRARGSVLMFSLIVQWWGNENEEGEAQEFVARSLHVAHRTGGDRVKKKLMGTKKMLPTLWKRGNELSCLRERETRKRRHNCSLPPGHDPSFLFDLAYRQR